MADGTGASPQQMGEFARKAGEASQALNGVFSRLDGDLLLLEGHSRGQFASAFARVRATVLQESTVMHQALNSIGADVGTAGVVYSTADSDMGSSMDQVSGSTSGITSGLTRG